jgi:hypothetical protein
MDVQHLQAYALVGAEQGYISIGKLIDNDVELDLHFQPIKIK